MASAATTSADVAPGTGRRCWRAGRFDHQAAQRRSVGQPEHEPQHVDALVVQLGPQRFGHHHVERLGGAVGDHVRRPDQTRRPTRRARCRRGRARPSGRRSGGTSAPARRSCAAPSQRRPRPDRQEGLVVRVGAGAVHQKADVDVVGRRPRPSPWRRCRRSTASGSGLDARSARIDAATSSSDALSAGEECDVDSLFGHGGANAAPTPSEAPAMRAQGPYRPTRSTSFSSFTDPPVVIETGGGQPPRASTRRPRFTFVAALRGMASTSSTDFGTL